MTYLRAGRAGEQIYHLDSPEELKEIRLKKQPYRLVASYFDEQGRVCGYDVALMSDPAPLPRAG